jgi:hypothetical protein
MLIQIDLPKKLHKELRIEKVKRDNIRLSDTVVDILQEALK